MTSWLHFIGSRVYGMRRFEHEAKKIGAQRGLPFSVIRGPAELGEEATMEYGDRVLVAEYKTIQPRRKGTTGRKPKAVPTATVFGYFRVDSFVWADIPDALRTEVLKHLDIVDIIPAKEDTQEDRACGSYGMGPMTIINDNLADVAGIIENVFIAAGVDPNSYKYLVRGRYEGFKNPAVIRGQKFFHGYKRLDDKATKALGLYAWGDMTGPKGVQLKGKKEAKPGVLQIFNYSKRRYVPKAERDAIDKVLEEEVKEARRP
jgi:hypothetical protein